MAFHIYNASVITSGTAISFGASEDIYVGEDALIGSQSGNAIVCSGGEHSVTLNGAVVSDSSGIVLGSDAAADSGQSLYIGKGATIDSAFGFTVAIKGYASFFENSGVLTGYFGVDMNGDSASYQSKLINNGTIKTDATYAFAPAVSHEGSEDFRLVNNGLIKASKTSFSGASASGDQTVVNNGKMVGEVQLGSGDDVYNGQKGIITNGIVWAGDGDDRLIGGGAADLLRGSTGHDILTGGKGADHFVYLLIADSLVAGSGRDLITDFSHSQHDKIDLGSIDAIANNANTGDRFSFIGTTAFDGHAGELHFFSRDGDTFVAADVDGDKHADFEIELSGIISLHGSDFIL